MRIVALRLNKNKENTREEIIAGCRAGKAASQEALFKRFAPMIMTVCRRYEHPEFGASDILQETFIAVFKNIGRFDAKRGSLEAWMKKIAVNTALKIIRKRKISFLDIERDHLQFEDISEEEVEVGTFSEEYLLEKIQELPQGYRTIFNLFVIENFSHKEIAMRLGVSVQTSKSQLSKAKNMLRKKLSANETSGKKQNTRS